MFPKGQSHPELKATDTNHPASISVYFTTRANTVSDLRAISSSITMTTKVFFYSQVPNFEDDKFHCIIFRCLKEIRFMADESKAIRNFSLLLFWFRGIKVITDSFCLVCLFFRLLIHMNQSDHFVTSSTCNKIVYLFPKDNGRSTELLHLSGLYINQSKVHLWGGVWWQLNVI